MTLLITSLILLVLYTIPAMVAYLRYHRNFTPILLTNIFFGWTLIGWVGSLIWATSANRQA